MNLYPLKFEPIFKPKIWGGQKLKEIFNKDIPTDDAIGESWELADLPEDKSTIQNGQFARQTLHALLEKYSLEITGNPDYQPPFPLLIKFLDTEALLSIQVHPDEKTCKKLGKGNPKTECWYIITAQPNAAIYKGLKKNVTEQQFSEAVKNSSVDKLLNKFPVQQDQCHFLPAGTPHSIGQGLLIAEIQTPSDTTYRLFDFNRIDKNGKKRQLHIEDALQSINFNQSENDLPVTTVGRLVDCPYFKIDKGHQAENCELILSPDEMKVLLFLTGLGKIISTEGASVDFKPGDCILIPAVYQGFIKFESDTKYLKITI